MDSRDTPEGRWRRRCCGACGVRFTTWQTTDHAPETVADARAVRAARLHTKRVMVLQRDARYKHRLPGVVKTRRGDPCAPCPSVRIVDPTHPHAQESGTLTGNSITVGGTPMTEVRLDQCAHGTRRCFVTRGQLGDEQAILRAAALGEVSASGSSIAVASRPD